VIASVDTYVRFADAVGRLDIGDGDRAPGLPQLMANLPHDLAKAKTKGVIRGAAHALGLGDKDDGRRRPAARRTHRPSTRT
jgi:gas vesicle structural protein